MEKQINVSKMESGANVTKDGDVSFSSPQEQKIPGQLVEAVCSCGKTTNFNVVNDNEQFLRVITPCAFCKQLIEVRAVDRHSQYVEAMTRMDGVLNMMREEQVASQQVTDDASTITHCEFNPAGGVYTFLARYEKPFRGFPYHGTVQAIDELKKLAKVLVQDFMPYFKKLSLFAKLRLFLSVDHISKLAESYLIAYHWHIKRYRLKPMMYSQPVREVFRVISSTYDYILKAETREAVRDWICMFLEFDNAYRFRFQDTVSEMDKDNLVRNPLREIERLMDLLISREVREDGKGSMADKWKMIKKLVLFLLRTRPFLLKKIKDVLVRIELGEIKLSSEDRYYCEFRKDYKFGFMTRENILRREIPKSELISVPQVESTIEIK